MIRQMLRRCSGDVRRALAEFFELKIHRSKLNDAFRSSVGHAMGVDASGCELFLAILGGSWTPFFEHIFRKCADPMRISILSASA